jgi:PPK2 family polyphosphate:nucleotide phosphotransferase
MPSIKSKTDRKSKTQQPTSALEEFRLPDGPVDLAALSTKPHPGSPGTQSPRNKAEAAKLLTAMSDPLSELQERLFAESTGGGRRRVLLILQGMDTSGKDGVVKHVMGLMNPAGIQLTSFKKPTPEEKRHDFLWRIESRLPEPGHIAVFNRSQYEDVLVQRVHNIVPPEVWGKRYAEINAFERSFVRTGGTILKCFLHISKEVQAERLLARLADPHKYWKFLPEDVDERSYWNDYQEAYRVALERCSTKSAPWYVIPGDSKWYRNWAVAALLLDALRGLDPQYPPPAFDVAEQRERLLAEEAG